MAKTKKPMQKQQPNSQPIPTSTAAKLLTLSVEHVARLCQQGEFKTAVQPSGSHGQWRIDRQEVIDRMTPKKK